MYTDKGLALSSFQQGFTDVGCTGNHCERVKLKVSTILSYEHSHHEVVRSCIQTDLCAYEVIFL